MRREYTELTDGQRIKKAMELTGLTLDAWQQVLGIRSDVIKKWHADEEEPNSDTLYKIAELTGVTYDWIFGIDPPMPTWCPEIVIPLYPDIPPKDRTAYKAWRLLSGETNLYATIDEVIECLDNGLLVWGQQCLVFFTTVINDEEQLDKYAMYF